MDGRKRMGKKKWMQHRDFPGGQKNLGKEWMDEKEWGRKNGCNIGTSQEVTHPSTILAQRRLTS
jgi:hypothetical protein